MAILGIDEVGRGPLAGPLVVGAVILPYEPAEWVAELKDSKKLSAKKREVLSEVIWREAPAVGLGWVTPYELDEVGISEALRLATRRAVKAVQKLHKPFSQIVIDGKVNFLSGTALGRYTSTMVKADDLVKEVSAASIVAKVARDAYMCEAAAEYPGYGFEKHMGYGTAVHREAIQRLGLCPEHRRSYEPCKSLCGFARGEMAKKDTTGVGDLAEEAVANYLMGQGHEIVARNFKTYVCEIDIVSVCEGKIYFTEVKYRRDGVRGGGLAAITSEKRKQMEFAVQVFLKYYTQFAAYDPLLAVAAVTGDFEMETWFPLTC